MQGIRKPISLKKWLIYSSIPILSLLLILLSRKLIYDLWLPTSVIAKMGNPLSVTISGGFNYFLDFIKQNLSLGLLVAINIAGLAVIIIKVPDKRYPALFLFLNLLGGILTVLMTGGDWMRAHRFCLPLIPILF